MAPPRTAAVAWMRAWEPAIPAYVTAGIPDSGAKNKDFIGKSLIFMGFPVVFCLLLAELGL